MRVPVRSRSAVATDVLVLCTGNICRSPYLAARLRQALPELRIESAGLGALAGEPPSPPVVAALAAQGVDPAALPVARHVTRAMIRSARLVVVATGMHRARVITMEPTAEQRCFTVKELARLLRGRHGLGVAGAAAAAATAASQQTRDFQDDLADPYLRGDDAYAAMFADADAALGTIIAALAERGR